jgi:hypothetical protein
LISLYRAKRMLQNFRELVDTLLKRKDRGLKQQWLEHYDLPPRETKADLPRARKGNLYQQWVEEGSLAPEDVTPEQVTSVVQKNTDSLLVKRLTKYIIIEGAVIVVLLVALAVVATMLAVKAG